MSVFVAAVMHDLGWTAGGSVIVAGADSMSMKAPKGIAIVRWVSDTTDARMGNAFGIFSDWNEELLEIESEFWKDKGN